ncbi:unnamed protein product [Mycena citricolor]|uniref:Uncharacterized protein n=1 Tax=Mycena citricolor TaxID=2018698 RepID=A0AAD2Q3H2_9AGAR|nr:unnamed protein product [Mycena citricolor]
MLSFPGSRERAEKDLNSGCVAQDGWPALAAVPLPLEIARQHCATRLIVGFASALAPEHPDPKPFRAEKCLLRGQLNPGHFGTGKHRNLQCRRSSSKDLPVPCCAHTSES